MKTEGEPAELVMATYWTLWEHFSADGMMEYNRGFLTADGLEFRFVRDANNTQYCEISYTPTGRVGLLYRAGLSGGKEAGSLHFIPAGWTEQAARTAFNSLLPGNCSVVLYATTGFHLRFDYNDIAARVVTLDTDLLLLYDQLHIVTRKLPSYD